MTNKTMRYVDVATNNVFAVTDSPLDAQLLASHFGIVLAPHLDDVKQQTIELIEQNARDFHELVVGTADKSREARFALNLELAQKLLAGTASAVEQQALQMQLDANHQANHPILKNKNLNELAEWIKELGEKSIKGSGLIEAIRTTGIALVSAAQSIDEIEQIKQQLLEQAQTALAQL